MTELDNAPQIGRNEPCPCGSKKKYKRCCGANAAPKLSTPAVNPALEGGMPGGVDPSQFDPQMMAQFSQMLGRLPKGQLQKLQGLMQRAMSGKDVTREAKEFEQSLPVELQTMLSGFQMPGALPSVAAPSPQAAEQGMTEEEARAIVESAAQQGKISGNQAEALLKESRKTEGGGFSKLWKKIGKKPSSGND